MLGTRSKMKQTVEAYKKPGVSYRLVVIWQEEVLVAHSYVVEVR